MGIIRNSAKVIDDYQIYIPIRRNGKADKREEGRDLSSTSATHNTDLLSSLNDKVEVLEDVLATNRVGRRDLR